jgi:DNA adenine methylase
MVLVFPVIFKKDINYKKIKMITYFGSKSRIGKWIVEYYPKDIETYVEPFSGAFWCFFNMKLEQYPNLKTVVYNDFNQLNSNLFNCARHPEEFHKELLKYPCQQYQVTETPPEYREMFIQFQKEVFDPNLVLTSEPNFEVGAKYAYVLSQTFSSMKVATASYVDLRGKYRSKFLSFVNKFNDQKYLDHLSKITFVENADFQTIIEKYDSPTTFFYLDPPYKDRETQYSKHNFVTDTHERLMKVMKNTKGKWCLSYYDFPELSEWYPKDQYRWEEKDFKKASGASKGKKQSTGTEILIMNY